MSGRPTHRIDRNVRNRIIAVGVLSLVAWTLLQAMSPRSALPWSEEMAGAAARMHQAMEALAAYCDSAGIPIDESLDPNRTCLIGPEYTPLFTTLGQLEAKRTTTNPDVAALLAHLFGRAGVSAGDTIAVGASASFPALLIATQCAAEEMRVHPVVVLSVGASSYGATRPDFNLLDMHQLLVAKGVLRTSAAAVSLGGEGDVGAEFEESLTGSIARRVEASGIPFLHDPTLRGSVAKRMEIYGGVLGKRPVAAFVNIGGSDANIGTSPLVLDVRPGVHTDLELPAPRERGVLYEMAAQGVPVIHLLYIRGLVLQHGLPWDPVPLPEPGTTQLYAGVQVRSGLVWLVVIAYFASLGATVAWCRREPRGESAPDVH